MNDTVASKSPATSNQGQTKPKSTVDKTRAAANKALDRTLDTARDAADRTAKAIDANPLPVLLGGLAVGAVAGALLPRSQREVQLLAPVGKRIKETTGGAVQAARDTGLQELGAIGLSKAALHGQAGKLVGDILKALATAGTAAILASKETGKTAAPANKAG
jgi:ElaB/YqjD/DUF883 family membrane-anchored ribosome-binding protein